MANELTFTVFTPTYNRAHTLPRVYASLAAQTCRDFEWLVIDDGSTDGTGALVAAWQQEADFLIRYIWQENGGKHTAHNRALTEARGRFIVPLDSDDEALPNTLERLLEIWETIPVARRAEFAFVRALYADVEGNRIGDCFPQPVYDAHLTDTQYIDKVHGDKSGMMVTEILRRYPFPVLPQKTTHVPEGAVLMRIGARYLARCVNDVLMVVHFEPGSLTRPTGGSAAVAPAIAPAFVLYYRQMLNEQAHYARHDPVTFLRAASSYVRFSWHLGHSLLRQWRALDSTLAHLLFIAGIAPGTMVYLRDRRYAWRNTPVAAR